MTNNDVELVDVVDEKGNVLEVVPKPDAHKRGLLHKTVMEHYATTISEADNFKYRLFLFSFAR